MSFLLLYTFDFFKEAKQGGGLKQKRLSCRCYQNWQNSLLINKKLIELWVKCQSSHLFNRMYIRLIADRSPIWLNVHSNSITITLHSLSGYICQVFYTAHCLIFTSNYKWHNYIVFRKYKVEPYKMHLEKYKQHLVQIVPPSHKASIQS